MLKKQQQADLFKNIFKSLCSWWFFIRKQQSNRSDSYTFHTIPIILFPFCNAAWRQWPSFQGAIQITFCHKGAQTFDPNIMYACTLYSGWACCSNLLMSESDMLDCSPLLFCRHGEQPGGGRSRVCVTRVRGLRRPHCRPLLALQHGALLAHALPEVLVLPGSAGRHRHHLLQQRRDDPVQERLHQVRTAVTRDTQTACCKNICRYLDAPRL